MKAVNATLDTIVSLARAEFCAVEEFDQAATDRDATLQALVQAIGYTPGVAATDEAVEEFAAIREAYVAAWLDVAKCEKISAERQFQRVVQRGGIIKPQSAAALKKQAERAKAKADKPATPKDGKGAEKAEAAKGLVLTAMEAHIIMLLRQHKIEQAAQCVADWK